VSIDLGIKGRSALVCGSSSGLGEACATSLARSGVTVVLNGRSEEKLAAAAKRVAAAAGGAEPKWVAADVGTPAGRDKLLAALPKPDILIANSGGPPLGPISSFSEAQWQAAINGTMMASVHLVNAVIPGMAERKWGRIINIASAILKAPQPNFALSSGPRAGLIAVLGGLAREVAPHGITINSLLPGTFLTDRLRGLAGMVGQGQGKSLEESLKDMAAAAPARRIGDPKDFGDWCAFFCSEQAAYITGQNLVMDGGVYPGLF
jgi:3-oxoacyl-[acyl-carrier protein] reductase